MGDLKERLDKKTKKIKKAKQTNTELVQKDVMFKEEEVGNEKNKPTMKNKRKREIENNVDTGKPVQISQEDKLIKAEQEMKKNKSQKKKRKNEEKNNSLVGKFDQLGAEGEHGFDDKNDEAADQSPFKAEGDFNSAKGLSEADIGTEIKTRKSKKSKNKKKEKDHSMSKDGEIVDKRGEADQDEDDVYCISSGDEGCSKGMKKWITEYHQSRPGLKVLQQSIDEFITAHEEKLEQERKEREAHDAEGGWTVVVHHKGRKKTTVAESGITVGSTNKTVVEDQVTRKKRKEVGLNFYRFQRREAQRNEILALQSKFEQEKSRIQQLRAARKFRPY